MRRVSDPLPDRALPRFARFLAFGAMVACLAVSAAVSEQETGQGSARGSEPAAPPAEAPESSGPTLAAQIQAAYEVLPIRGGVVLLPRRQDLAFKSLEVTEEGFALDGQPVDEPTLRERLGEAAGPVLRFAALEPDERSRILALAPRVEAPEPQPATPAETGAAPGGTEGERPGRGERRGEKIRLVGDVTIGKDEVAEEAVVIAGTLRVDGEVEEGALVMGGDARIEGRVGRELMVVGGDVVLGPHAVVDGDISLVGGGEIRRTPGSEVTGKVRKLGLSGRLFRRLSRRDEGFDDDWLPRFGFGRWLAGVVGSVVWLGFLVLTLSLVVLFSGDAVGKIERRIRQEPWKSAVTGLLFPLIFAPLLGIAVIFLAISIIGIPVLILVPVLLFVIAVAILVGYAGALHTLGRAILERLGRGTGGRFLPVVAALVVIDAACVMGHFLDFAGDLGGLVYTLGVLAHIATFVVGFGAVVMLVLEHRGSRRRAVGGPASQPAGSVPPPPAPSTSEEARPDGIEPEVGEEEDPPTPDPGAPDQGAT